MFLVVFRIAPKHNSFYICKYTKKKTIILYYGSKFSTIYNYRKNTTFASLANLLLSHFGGVLALIFLMVSWLIYLDILFFAENP